MTEGAEIAALGHDYEEVAGTGKPATCTESGKEADRKCRRCDDMITGAEIPAPGHSWSEWKVTEAAEGEETRTCSRCNENETRIIPNHEHVHNLIKAEAKAATCTENGNTVYWICSSCGNYFSDEEGNNQISIEDTVIKAQGHIAAADPAAAPTCAESGLTEGAHCSVCGEIIMAQEIIPATGKHIWDAGKITKSATVLTTGVKTYTCKVCNQTKTEKTDKLTPTIKLSKTKKSIKVKKSFTLKISKLAKGDAVKSVKSSKAKIAKVKKLKNNKYKITGKKKGKAVIKVKLKSGKTAKCTVTVK